MDFSYYNDKNEQVNLNIEIDKKWSDLNIQNTRINSIFSKIDNGDGIVSKDEYSLLDKLFKKADEIIDIDTDNILANEELDEIIEKIDDGTIILPQLKENIVELKLEKSLESITHSPKYSKQDYADLKDPQKVEIVHEKYIAKIKEDLRKYHHYDEKFPESQYDIEVVYNGKDYESFVFEKNKRTFNEENTENINNIVQKLTGNVEITREDGIKFQIKDDYEGAIDNNDNDKFIDINYGYVHSYQFGSITITDNNGVEHKFRSHLSEAFNVLDMRRQELAIANFFNRIPSEKIKELIDNNIKSISFSSEPDEMFEDIYNLDENGEEILIILDTAQIVSPTFALPKRNYDIEVKSLREDNYEISIKDIDEKSSELTIKSQNGKNYTIPISLSDDCDTDTFHQILRPQLIEILNNLSSDVLNDFISEINEIRLTIDSSNAGVYSKGSNTLSIDYDSNSNVSSNPEITFIHELGHALDNIKNIYSSESSDFSSKYKEFSELAQKYEYETIKNSITFEEYQNGKEIKFLGIMLFRNHALDNEKEFFASCYADINYTGESNEKNHIKELEKIILSFKDSSDPNKQKCYQLYQELRGDVNNMITNIRNKSPEYRKDDSLKNFVLENGKETFDILRILSSEGVIHLVADSPELTLINYLSRNEDEFINITKKWTSWSNYSDMPNDIKNNLSILITKINELRNNLNLK